MGLRGTDRHGSLREWGVAYREVALTAGGEVDFEALAAAVHSSTSAIWGLGFRNSCTCAPACMQLVIPEFLWDLQFLHTWMSTMLSFG